MTIYGTISSLLWEIIGIGSAMRAGFAWHYDYKDGVAWVVLTAFIVLIRRMIIDKEERERHRRQEAIQVGTIVRCANCDKPVPFIGKAVHYADLRDGTPKSFCGWVCFIQWRVDQGLPLPGQEL